MEMVIGLWTLGRVCAIVSAVKCVSLMIHRPVPLGQIIHYMLIKIIFKKYMCEANLLWSLLFRLLKRNHPSEKLDQLVTVV